MIYHEASWTCVGMLRASINYIICCVIRIQLGAVIVSAARKWHLIFVCGSCDCNIDAESIWQLKLWSAVTKWSLHGVIGSICGRVGNCLRIHQIIWQPAIRIHFINQILFHVPLLLHHDLSSRQKAFTLLALIYRHIAVGQNHEVCRNLRWDKWLLWSHRILISNSIGLVIIYQFYFPIIAVGDNIVVIVCWSWCGSLNWVWCDWLVIVENLHLTWFHSDAHLANCRISIISLTLSLEVSNSCINLKLLTILSDIWLMLGFFKVIHVL